jgi:hypothetical protein
MAPKKPKKKTKVKLDNVKMLGIVRDGRFFSVVEATIIDDRSSQVVLEYKRGSAAPRIIVEDRFKVFAAKLFSSV